MIRITQIKISLSKLEQELGKLPKPQEMEENERILQAERNVLLRQSLSILGLKKELAETEVAFFALRKKSVDARKKHEGEIYFIYTVDLALRVEKKKVRRLPKNASFLLEEEEKENDIDTNDKTKEEL